MDKEEYRHLLLDPRWKLRRLEILERDGNKCTVCGCEEQLQVHHNVYEEKAPWEYTDDQLETVCIDCHKKHHRNNSNTYMNYQRTRTNKFEVIDESTTLNGKSETVFTTSRGVSDYIFAEKESEEEDITNNVLDILANMYDFTSIQNSGQIKINVKSIIGDVKLTLLITGYFKKELNYKTTKRVAKSYSEKPLTKKQLRTKISDEYFANLKIKRKLESEKRKAIAEAKRQAKVSSEISMPEGDEDAIPKNN